jgi:hypothetical protein
MAYNRAHKYLEEVRKRKGLATSEKQRTLGRMK